MVDLKKIQLNTQKVYEEEANAFDRQRDKSLFEKNWLDLFIFNLKNEPEVLDVGCGPGEPISGYLIKNNIALTGIDYSKSMIEIASRKFPDNVWKLMDMRNLQFNQKFDGIIAWNSFFHLNQKEQVKVIKNFSDYLKNKGLLLFTAGPEKGEVTGKVNNRKVYHSSLSLIEYQKELKKVQIELVQFKLNDPNCNNHSIFLGKKL